MKGKDVYWYWTFTALEEAYCIVNREGLWTSLSLYRLSGTLFNSGKFLHE